MVSPDDFSKIVADKYRPIFYFMVVTLGGLVFCAHWTIQGYNLYVDRGQDIIDLNKEVALLKAQDTVTRKQLARMLQNNTDALTTMFARHDINGDMAEECLSVRRKRYYHKRLKQQLKDEMLILLNAAKVAHD